MELVNEVGYNPLSPTTFGPRWHIFSAIYVQAGEAGQEVSRSDSLILR